MLWLLLALLPWISPAQTSAATDSDWINGAPLAGETFGCGPSGSGALAFVDRAGRVSLVDREQPRQTIAGVKNAALPAWSDDGSWIAFLQKSSRRRYMSTVVAISGMR
jgi:hypothetical protein